jgi:hypothetical protein
MDQRSGIHGFASWIDFIKATLSLGIMLTAGVYAILVFALDSVYAPLSVVEQVESNGRIAKSVQSQVEHVQGSVNDLRETILAEQIFETKIRSCGSAGETGRYFAQRLVELKRQYYDLEGHEAIVPDCADLQ